MQLNDGPQTYAYHTAANEVLFGGAAGGSKSYLLRALGLSWCLEVPGIQVYLFRRTHPQLVKNHLVGNQNLLQMAWPWTNVKFARWNWGRHALEFKNGSNFFMCHAQHEFDVYDYQGPEIHALLMDELTTFTAFQYRFLRGRCRAPGLEIPKHCPWTFPRICSGSNPGGTGHNWVKAAFVSAAIPYRKWRASKSEGGMVRQYVPARLTDNTAMTLEQQQEYADKLHGLGDPALVKALLDGNWDIVAGGMFDDVWDLEYNTCDPFDIPAGWPITRSYDWGSSKPFSVGWWTESNGEEVTLRDGTKRTWPRGHRFRIMAWYGWNSVENGGYHDPEDPTKGEPNVGCKMEDAEIARGIIKREADAGWAGRVEAGAADRMIFDTKPGFISIAETMEAEGVFFEPADQSPGSRVNGWAVMRRMMLASHKVPQEDPGFTVFNTDIHFIRCVPVLPRHKIKTDDVDTDAEDHNGDESRYELSRVAPTATRVPIKGA